MWLLSVSSSYVVGSFGMLWRYHKMNDDVVCDIAMIASAVTLP